MTVKTYVVAMVKTNFVRPKTLEEAEKQKQQKAIFRLGVKKRYTLKEAEARAAELKKTHSEELKYLGYDAFVAYNTRPDVGV